MGLVQKLADEKKATQWLATLGVQDCRLALQNLIAISKLEFSQPGPEKLLDVLENQLKGLSDPDRAINNLERFAQSSPSTLLEVIGSEGEPISGLLVLFSTSQYLSDLIVANPEVFLSSWSASPMHSSESLNEIVVREIQQCSAEKEAMFALREFKHNQTLRIAINDLIRRQRIENVTLQISFVAKAVVEGAYQWARRELAGKLGDPKNNKGEPSQFVVLAMGKLGGSELNYSSDIDLVMLYDEDGMTQGGSSAGAKAISNQEFYTRLCRMMTKLIGEATELGAAYRVDLRLRPNGASGKICTPYRAMMAYYDLQGRTWERQALIKAAPIAGDLALGNRMLKELSTWIYRRNLSRADISGIKALKRKIERRAVAAGEDRTNIKTGHGGIRDVEFVIQFMQLLNGGELPEIRTTNTLDAISRLERAHCLSPAESTVLAQNYQWLRDLEHRLQLMFDMQVHTIPVDETELLKVAKRMGFGGDESEDPLKVLEQFRKTLSETTESNRKILNHLLHNSFGMAFGSLRDTGGVQHRFDKDEVPLEVDLVLDADPDEGMIEQVLTPYGFKDVHAAYKNLQDLSREPTQFLSTRRCKHFLASVAPALLSELARTPDPDASLVTLATVSDCLGAKGVLWELFSFNRPTLSLYVRLCASSDYLVGILKSNPGMIDELVDALQLEDLPTFDRLVANMEELTKGAEDLTPIIHGFKNTQHMRVGVRDILGRDDVRDTHLTLSDIAEICLSTSASHQTERLLAKYAIPDCLEKIRNMESPLVILGLGKLGGREPNYHSDLDTIFLYNSEPKTLARFEGYLKDETTSQFFFSELAAEITKFVGHSQRHGRLYEIDSRLRPSGKSGSLAVSTDEFHRYFDSGQGQTWERQALCRARAVFGSESNRKFANEQVRNAIKAHPWQPQMQKEIGDMRLAMQKDCSKGNLKRGEGGTVDVEFITQMLQLRYVAENDSVLLPGTRESLEKLAALGFLDPEHAERLGDGYQLLRSVEARLRLMNTTARHDLPTDQSQLEKLAYLLNYASAGQLTETVSRHRTEIREIFDELFALN